MAKYGAGNIRGKASTAQQNQLKKKSKRNHKQSSTKITQTEKRAHSSSASLEDLPAQPRAKKLKTTPSTKSYKPVSNAAASSDSQIPGGNPTTAALDRHDDAGASDLTDLGLSANQVPKPCDLTQADQLADSDTRVSPPPDPPLESTPSEPSVDEHSHNFIPFGALVSIMNPPVTIQLRGSAAGPTTYVLGGYGPCDIVIPSAPKRHSLLVLELRQSPLLPLHRSVEIKRIDPRDQGIKITKGGVVSELGESASLSNGDRFSELYRGQTPLSGFNHPDPNSRVSRAVRVTDGIEVVVKNIPPRCERWARTEITALKTIGYHRNVVQLVEAFYDKSTYETHIVFEPEDKDLFSHVQQIRLKTPSGLAGQRARITAELSSAVAHLHSLNLAHRDIKPQNILVSSVGTRKITTKLCDFGLVRLDTRPISQSG
ncbi:hypothetical protein FRB90_005255, partial [Tulasnella sp. 427]